MWHNNHTHKLNSKVMDKFTVESVVRGYHIYKTIWTPYIGEKLPLEAEDNNLHDRHAVAVIRNGTVVGHMPRNLLPLSWFFLKERWFN